jgi:YHS domain-containing protein
MNRLLYGICLMFVSLGIGGALTVRGQAPSAGVNHRNGVAIQGYDVVAYFTDNRAVPGQAQFSHTWSGVRWQFASASHRDAFAADPERYAPAFGGYCAYGVSRGYAVDIDPEAFAVADETLYLNYSKRVQVTWNQDRAGYIEKARALWPRVLAELK